MHGKYTTNCDLSHSLFQLGWARRNYHFCIKRDKETNKNNSPRKVSQDVGANRLFRYISLGNDDGQAFHSDDRVFMIASDVSSA